MPKYTKSRRESYLDDGAFQITLSFRTHTFYPHHLNLMMTQQHLVCDCLSSADEFHPRYQKAAHFPTYLLACLDGSVEGVESL